MESSNLILATKTKKKNACASDDFDFLRLHAGVKLIWFIKIVNIQFNLIGIYWCLDSVSNGFKCLVKHNRVQVMFVCEFFSFIRWAKQRVKSVAQGRECHNLCDRKRRTTWDVWTDIFFSATPKYFLLGWTANMKRLEYCRIQTNSNVNFYCERRGREKKKKLFVVGVSARLQCIDIGDYVISDQLMHAIECIDWIEQSRRQTSFGARKPPAT